MNLSNRIWHIGTVLTLLLLLLSLRLVYWQLVRGDELQPVVLNPIISAGQSEERLIKELNAETLAELENLPQPVVQRTSQLLAEITRGVIYDRNGRPLAYDVEGADGARFRFYTEPSLAPVIGYVTGLRVGVAGVEAAFNEDLLGLGRLDNQLRQITHQPIVGNDVHLTIDSRVQRAAAEALGGRPGAIVVMDGQSGAILGMVSQPGFDPNRILDPEYVGSILNCQAVECQGALLNRATQGLYTPGSTGKTLTLITALDSGLVTPQTVFDFGRQRQEGGERFYVYEVDGAVFRDPNHPESRLDLVRSYAVSANAAFARMGDELPPETLIDYAMRLGFGRQDGAPPIEIPAAPAQLANDLDELRNSNVLQASTGFGQGELLASPLNMALLVTAVINRGFIPVPHLLQQVQGPDGTLFQGEPAGYWIENIMRPETAEIVSGMMITAVRSGSGVRAAVQGLTIGGKTGTAEVEGQPPHAWFIGFAHDGTRTVVITVIVEHGGEGADVAAPIFAQVADAAMRHMGEPVEEVVPPPQGVTP
ncbi:MAG: penicillin-binding protein 2 [Chloroflexi bacterium]|nr:penicillin-binding protein 2 [Chloroflexota bacterium]MCI0575785.1 penicillin-binding protein 2 [Chloroflexota bacterium]MCI0643608.1 penicillin-binding protein 2 [Chloroflexota bacterium]MCI0726826.1 penicillin-binding protein 2 [Chloroflexota bacterium]